MNKYLIFTAILVVAAILLTACNTGANSVEISQMPNDSEMDIGDTGNSGGGESALPAEEKETETPSVEETLPPEEGSEGGEEVSEPETIEVLPIPVVEFGPGDAWFQPTDPAAIKLASGKVQFFEFSAVW